MDKNELESLKSFIEKREPKEDATILESTILSNSDSNSEDDIFVQETTIELVPTKTIRTTVNEDKLKEIIIPIIKNDKEFFNAIKGKNGTKGKDGISPNIDVIIDNLVNLLKDKESYLELVRGKDAPQLEEITTNLIIELKNDKEFLELVKGKDGVDQFGGWPIGGGLGERDVNELIDIKIANLNPNFDYVAFTDNLSENPEYNEGLMFYDPVNKTHAGYDDNPDVTIQYGQEIHTRVSNTTGATFLNGTLIQAQVAPISGVDDVIDGELALSTISNSIAFIGMVTHDIENNSIGKVTNIGTVSDINTSAYAKGTVLYLSHTVAGAFTDVPPPSPYSTIEIGQVVKSHATEGKILIKIDTKPYTFVDEKLVFVATNGIDTSAVDGSREKPYATLGYALSTITDQTAMNRYKIQITPGVYAENNPIQLKSYITIDGGVAFSSVLSATNDAPLLESADRCILNGVGLLGHVSATVVNVNHSGVFRITNCIVYSGNIGINIDNVDSTLALDNFVGAGTGDTLLKISNGIANVTTLQVATISNYTNGIFIDGENSYCTGYGYLDDSNNVNKAFWVKNNGKMAFKTGSIRGATYGMYLEDCDVTISETSIHDCDFGIYIPPTATSAIAYLNNTEMYDCISDVQILSPTAIVGGSGVADISKMIINANANVVASFVDVVEGNQGQSVIGELHVGIPNKGSESCLGEGDSYTTGMLVYTSAVGVPLEDVSIQAKSLSGSTFGFPNTSLNSTIYIASTLSGSDDEPIGHYGIKSYINTARNTGTIIAEYYTSGGWVEVNTMTTEGDSPYYPLASNLFNDSGIYQIRYDANLAVDGWQKNDPVGYGSDLYWTRFRVTSACDVAPVFEQFKLHSNRMEINSDGWPEYFGRARPIGRLPWDAGLVEAATASPSDQDVFISDTLDIGRRENEFSDSAIDRMGFISPLPFDCDTSTPIRVQWSHFSHDTGGAVGGDAVWVVRWGYVEPDGNLYPTGADAPTTGPNEQSTTFTSAVPAINTQQVLSVDIDVSNMIARRENGFGDTLFITIERTGTDSADTATYNSVLVAISGYYTKWSEGGHI